MKQSRSPFTMSARRSPAAGRGSIVTSTSTRDLDECEAPVLLAARHDAVCRPHSSPAPLLRGGRGSGSSSSAQRQSPARTRCSGVHSVSSLGIAIAAAGLVAVQSASSETSYVEDAGRTLTVTSLYRPDRCLPFDPEQRLRPLSEEECYLRCYGWRGERTPSRSSPPGTPRSESPAAAHRADPHSPSRRAWTRASPKRHSPPARPRPPPSRTCSRPGSPSSSAGSTRAASRTRPSAHFANPRNDFWRLLHAAGFTPRLFDPTEQFDAAPRSGSASRTPPTARRRARATCARATSRAAPSGSRRSRASSGRA